MAGPPVMAGIQDPAEPSGGNGWRPYYALLLAQLSCVCWILSLLLFCQQSALSLVHGLPLQLLLAQTSASAMTFVRTPISALGLSST